MSEITTQPAAVAADEVREWLRGRVAAHTGRPVEEIRSDLPLNEYGLDSVYVLGLCATVYAAYLAFTLVPHAWSSYAPEEQR